jgi:PKD repeat protein
LTARNWRGGLGIAVLCAAGLALSLAPTPADAVLSKVAGRGYGVTPIKGLGPSNLAGTSRSPRASALSGSARARNFDGPPFGGGPLEYQGGPVMHSNNTHVIYWDPNSEFTTTTKTIIANFFTDVAHDSGLASNVFGIAGQYTDSTGNAAYSSTFAGEQTDLALYPTVGNCTTPKGPKADLGPYATCLFDSQLQIELAKFIKSRGLPTGPTQLYFLALPHSVTTCLPAVAEGEQECSNNLFCAYHSYINPGTASEIIYAAIPFSLLDASAKDCQDDGTAGIQQPNPDNSGGKNTETRFADVALKYISHEAIEAITDPLVNNQTAWVDEEGQEIGDKCNGVQGNGSGVGYDANSFLPTLGGEALSDNLFDQSIGEGHFYLQSEWDNAGAACLMKPLAIGTPGFTASPSTQLVGKSVTFVARATDPYGKLAVAWSFGDGSTGAGQSPSHTFSAPGVYTVTMTTSDALTHSTGPPVEQEVVVNDSPTASFTMSPNPATAGTSIAFNGTGSSDADGSIASYAWSFGDGGTGAGATPSHAYAAPGTYTATLSVTDSAGVTAATAQQVTVTAPPEVHIAVVAPNGAFGHLGAKLNARTGTVTFTGSVADPGSFKWLLTFQNGRFGVFAASAAKCKTGFVRLGGRCRPARIVFGRGSKLVATPGRFTFTVRPTASALKALKNALKQRKPIPVLAHFTFQSIRGGSPVSHAQSLSVKLQKG